MEKRNNLLIALVALIALVVGVFAGMNMQGSGFLQGKLGLTKDTSKQCEEYRILYYQGLLTETLGASKAEKAIKNCQSKYPNFWDAVPTLKECKSLKDRLDYYGAGKFSDFLKKSKISSANTVYCGYNYPFLWYGTSSLNENECWAYKSLVDEGGLTAFLNGNIEKASKIQITCSQKVVGWGPVNSAADKSTCETYKLYLDQGNLSSMIANGEADAQIAFSCSKNYPAIWQGASNLNVDTCVTYKQYVDQGILTDMINQGKAKYEIAQACDAMFKYIWNGVTKEECEQFAEWQEQKIFTQQLGSTQKASDATAACNYYGYNLFN